ncbi:hypothetical protein L226DRAFT_248724 [Lentinus tigrinus ALCF2SS1-7]|uniref:Fungal-type protein kinase domain-containing protein n=1 Tax=Lentinus tigrinus ALCF2SS1-6 TaxID=1328759 RepID=A0A5C2SMZ0_9APHY|nr:hypothetical protein L227DRAFT_204897 [Lentinus tigrinus ALCF2SS1-6]RPD79386.1 hypothetical protein L226DRAFT_248724 [Lentinus tigrinus ALCF2SS1-7]
MSGNARPSLTMKSRCLLTHRAMYGAEQLGSLPCVLHTIDMLIRDDVIWLFWFDHQGVIQSFGVKFVQHTPMFLLVLMALQRFNTANWGLPNGLPHGAPADEFVKLEELTAEHSTSDSQSSSISVNWSARTCRSLHFVGRCTQIFDALVRRRDAAVAKLSFPDVSRVSEAVIVQRAREVQTAKFDLQRHLPVLHFVADVRPQMSAIREFLNITTDACVARLTIWEKLTPIVHLRGADFRRCWFELIHAHHLLWNHGIRHLDPSAANMMVRYVGGASRCPQ